MTDLTWKTDSLIWEWGDTRLKSACGKYAVTQAGHDYRAYYLNFPVWDDLGTAPDVEGAKALCEAQHALMAKIADEFYAADSY